MKKEWFAFMSAFVLVFSFSQKIYAQEILDSEAASKILFERSLSVNDKNLCENSTDESIHLLRLMFNGKERSDTWFSNDSDDMNSLIGTKWRFIYRIGSTTFTDEIIFDNTIITNPSSGVVGLSCSNQYGKTGVALYGELPISLGGGLGYVVSISGTTLDDYYTFKITGERSNGYYMFKSKTSGTRSNTYILTGTRLSDPSDGSTDDDDDNDSAIDVSNCKIMPKSMSISNTRIPTINDYVNFTVNAISDCSATFYYYYSYAPDYGTDNYGQSDWVKMVSSGNGFSSSNTVSYKFPNSGYYVVVAWISSQMAPSDPINMIGCTVAIK